MLDTPLAETEVMPAPVVVRDPLYTPAAIAERKALIRSDAEALTVLIDFATTGISWMTKGVAEPDWNRVRAMITRKAGLNLLLKQKGAR